MERLGADRAGEAHEPAARVADAPGIAALEPLRVIGRRWPRVLGVVLTVAMVAGLARELFDAGLVGLDRTVPDSPLFYLFFLLSYFALPVVDYLIFRRLWGIPPSAFGAINRKRIANDVLLGYSGDAYFYAWARARLRIVAAPFGAVKDVSIVSGMAGNTAAVLLAAVALPLGYELIAPEVLRAMLWSLAITAAIMGLVLFLSPIVFTLPARALWRVFRWDCARIALGALFLSLAWHFAMPSVSLLMWLFLMAGRQLVSRLPFLPNKDLLFANFAILIIGHDRALSELIAFTAASTLLVHLLLTGAFGARYAWERIVEWRRSG